MFPGDRDRHRNLGFDRVPVDYDGRDQIGDGSRSHDHQYGVRTIEMSRSIPKRFDPTTDEGQELIAAALVTLVDDGSLETVKKGGTTYYRLAED